MSRRFLNFASAAAILAWTNLGFGGGWSGNGGDLLQDQDNAWFIGNETVEYCIERGDDFPLNFEELRNLVTESLHDWVNFFSAYGIDQRVLGRPGTLGGLFPNGQIYSLSLKFKQVEHCNALRQQVRFLFGTTTAIIDQFRLQKGDALGFAIRPAYNHDTYRNGGFIWIPGIETQAALNWLDHPLLLKHLLLHELGHLFGMRHDSVYVMSSTISAELINRLSFPVERLESDYGRIEHPAWPYRFQDGGLVDLTHDQGGSMGIPPGYRSNLLMPAELRRSLHMQGDGYHRFQLRYLVNQQAIVLEINDHLSGLHRFELPKLSHLSWKGYDNGPGVYTKWLSNSGEPFFARIGLDLGDDALPFEGVWKIGDKTYPMTIEIEPQAFLELRQSRVVLRIFLEASKTWMILR